MIEINAAHILHSLTVLLKIQIYYDKSAIFFTSVILLHNNVIVLHKSVIF